MTRLFTYGSVCSGIGVDHVAWAPFGWQCGFFAETAAFPSAVLAERFPEVPNLGDFTVIGRADVGAIDLLAGGTPCQSFSIAGKRGGLDDHRGGLACEFARLAECLGARWLVWENVRGVLSSWSGAPQDDDIAPGGRWEGDESHDFTAVLDAFVECGYGCVWRTLDTQYVRVQSHPLAAPQRRQRVFVVGYLGDWRPAAAVLLEPEGLRRDPPPRREAGQVAAGTFASGARGSGIRAIDFEVDGGLIASEVAGTLRANTNGGRHAELVAQTLVGSNPYGDHAGRESHLVAYGGNNTSGPVDVAIACRAKGGSGHSDFESETFLVQEAPVAFQGRGSNLDVDQDVAGTLGTNIDRASGGAPCIAFHARQDPDSGSMTHPLDTDGYSIAIAFDETQITSAENRSQPVPGKACHTLAAGARPSTVALAGPQWKVRRLLPVECERLQGLPDDWTRIPWRGKPAEQCPDGPRYAAIGNAWSANVARWIAERIDLFERVVPRETIW